MVGITLWLLYTWERPSTQYTRVCVDLSAGVDSTENLASPRSSCWTVQPVASRIPTAPCLPPLLSVERVFFMVMKQTLRFGVAR